MKKISALFLLFLFLLPTLACGRNQSNSESPNSLEEIATKAVQIQVTAEAAATSVANIQAVATEAVSLQTTVVALATIASEQGLDSDTIEANIPEIGLDSSGNLTISFSDENLTAYISEGIKFQSENNEAPKLQNPTITINKEYLELTGDLSDPKGTLTVRFLPKVENHSTEIDIISASINENDLSPHMTAQIEAAVGEIFTQLEMNLPAPIQLVGIEIDNGRLTLILGIN